MTNFNLPNETFQYAYAAHDEARQAAVLANRGYRHKLAYYEDESIIRKWRELLVNAPVFLHNTLFILFAIADMIISWEMIRDVVTQVAIPPEIEKPAIFIFCLLINAWAAVTAHFIGRGWSREIQDWERWNYIFVKNRNQAPVNIVSDEMRREIRRARFWAIFSGLTLLGLVGVIIYYRNYITAEPVLADFDAELVPEESSENTGLKVVMTYLPLAIILGELLTGDYFWYYIRQIQKRLSRRINRNGFLKYKEACGVHDQLAMQHAQAARQKDEFIEIIGDLEKSHLRMKYRSQQNDDYIDPLDKFKRIGFSFRYRSSGKPVENAIVFGILPNGAKTGDYRTDEQGKVTLHPDGDFDRLIAINVRGREFTGPFQINGEHYLDVPEYLESVVENGH
jgi:hypothetical protein